METKVFASQSAAFHRTHGRWPSALAESRSESVIGTWLEQQRGTAASGRMAASERAVLDGTAPGWESNADSTWTGYARELSNFILAQRRCPIITTKDDREQTLAHWVMGHRHLASIGRLSAERSQWLAAHAPGWDGSLEALFAG